MHYSAVWAKTLSGLLTVVACTLSFQESGMHLKNFSRPEMQVRIVRILGMVPVYSITSWLSLISTTNESRLTLDFIRDLYEAFVIYNFISLLIRMGGGWRRTIFYLEDQPRAPHFFPLKLCLPPVQLGQTFLILTRAAALQFVLIKPLNGLLLLMAHQKGGLFGGFFSVNAVKRIAAITDNLSISAALYSLVMLHTALHNLLEKYHPLPKFWAVKMVVFFSFWQGVVLNAMVKVGFITDVEGFPASAQVSGIQDVLICLEMVVAALCHTVVFSWREWQDVDDLYDETEEKPLIAKILKIVDFRDFLTDWRDTVSGDGYEYEMRQNEPRNMCSNKSYTNI
uniref:Transmembrane protein 184C n=1 Tax=Rhodosorus marinus TaxID=101924 RepID=A0A7S0G2I6_9RHOD|mmetsp:Transcript_23011/g.33083  ORF Transcript_23011/g.33083 Transcript_23011/m.33083 type:complete len:339 (+) Transcript_23011:206-1222(+)